MKARYNFWTKRPCHVGRREYNNYQMYFAGLFLTGSLSLILAIVAISGANQRLQGAAHIPTRSVAAVANDRRDRSTAAPMDVVKLQGFLVTDAPLIMPDDPNLRVIRGAVALTAEAGRPDELISETLLTWHQTATNVFLSDGAMRVPIAFDLRDLPMQEDRTRWASIRRSDDSSAKPVAVEYAGQIYPLDQRFQTASSTVTKLTRQFLPNGQAVVLFAAVEATPNGGRLVDPLGQRLKVMLGTETAIVAADGWMRVVYGLLSLGLGIVTYRLKQAQVSKWQEFVQRSQQ